MHFLHSILSFARFRNAQNFHIFVFEMYNLIQLSPKFTIYFINLHNCIKLQLWKICIWKVQVLYNCGLISSCMVKSSIVFFKYNLYKLHTFVDWFLKYNISISEICIQLRLGNQSVNTISRIKINVSKS